MVYAAAYFTNLNTFFFVSKSYYLIIASDYVFKTLTIDETVIGLFEGKLET